jgi:hypothetical protein
MRARLRKDGCPVAGTHLAVDNGLQATAAGGGGGGAGRAVC